MDGLIIANEPSPLVPPALHWSTKTPYRTKTEAFEHSKIHAIVISVSWIVEFLSCGFFNTSYLTDSYIVFTLKMESAFKNTIFGRKMMVKSGLEKFILKSLHAGRYRVFQLDMLHFKRLLGHQKSTFKS